MHTARSASSRFRPFTAIIIGSVIVAFDALTAALFILFLVTK